jgi:hypothetical protein
MPLDEGAELAGRDQQRLDHDEEVIVVEGDPLLAGDERKPLPSSKRNSDSLLLMAVSRPLSRYS